DDDVGRPKNQVIRFQLMAPARAARTMYGMMVAATTSRFTMLAIVSATATPKPNAARKLKKAAKTTAFLGERTFVDTTVEIELAESWKPLVKSKTSAMTMIAPMSISGGVI